MLVFKVPMHSVFIESRKDSSSDVEFFSSMGKAHEVKHQFCEDLSRADRVDITWATVSCKQSLCSCTQGHTECTWTLTLALLHTSAQSSSSHESGRWGRNARPGTGWNTHFKFCCYSSNSTFFGGKKLNNIKKKVLKVTFQKCEVMFLRKENEVSSFNKSPGMLFFQWREEFKGKGAIKMECLSWKWWKIADLWCVCWQLGNWAKLVPLKQQRMETEKGNCQEHASSNNQSQQPSRFYIFPSSPWKTSWWNRARDEYQIQTLGFKNKMAMEGLSLLNLEWKRYASSSGYSSWWTP